MPNAQGTNKTRRIALAAVVLCSVGFVFASAVPEKTDEQRVIEGIVRGQSLRFDHIEGYSRLQHYAVTTTRFGLSADLVARIHRDRTKGKSFEVISRSGSPTIQSHVLDPLLEAEVAASHQGNNELLTPENYSFHLTGQEQFAGRQCYVLETEPKHKDKRLLKGKIWVDAEDFGVVHVEGRPSESLSFFVGRPMIVQDFTKIADFWWVARRHSYIDNMFLGKSDLVIDYSEYQFEFRTPAANAKVQGTAGSK